MIEDHVGSVPAPETGILSENGMFIPNVSQEFSIRVGSGWRSQAVFSPEGVFWTERERVRGWKTGGVDRAFEIRVFGGNGKTRLCERT